MQPASHEKMNEFIPTEISTDDLRYKSRAIGSPLGPHTDASLSGCQCGQHKPRSQGTQRKNPPCCHGGFLVF